MSLNGIGNSMLGGLRPAIQDPRARGLQPDRAPAAPTGTTAVRQPAAPVAKQAPTAVPEEAPPGTDPELWAVLSSDERAFFSRVGAMGPLTYGYVMQTGQMPTQPPAARGGRLDVRV
jgi:hypothetical protein